MGGLGGDVFCRWPYGAPAPQGRSCADCMVFAGDYFWQRVGHLSTLSDHVDWLPLSRFYACLFPAHRYTTFEMASRYYIYLADYLSKNIPRRSQFTSHVSA